VSSAPRLVVAALCCVVLAAGAAGQEVERGRGAFGSVVYRAPQPVTPEAVDTDLLPPPTVELLGRAGVPARPAGEEIPFGDWIREASLKFGVEEALIEAVILAESGFNPYAVSKAGAIGLMQLMPETAKRFGVREIFDPRENILAGTQYLSYLMSLFRGDVSLALAAYNAGEEAVARSGGVPPYEETQGYIHKVKRNLRILRTGGAGAADDDAPAAPEALLRRPSPPATTIYYYLDERGVVHFTNVKPPEGVGEVHVWRKR